MSIDRPAPRESEGRVVVIGVGNRDRGDDGVGPAVVDAVAALPANALAGAAVVIVEAAGDLSDLIVTWGRDDDVIVGDATIGPGAPGSIVVLDGLADRLPAEAGALSSHGLGVATTIELARRLGRLPRSLTVVGVRAENARIFGGLSPAVQRALPIVVSEIVERAGRGSGRAG